MYKLNPKVFTPSGFVDCNVVTRLSDGANIPFDLANKDYQDYLAWVDRYNLGEDERRERKNSINQVVKKSNNIIYKFGDSIKKIDIIMNDGINKMAENTAGYPFKFDVYVVCVTEIVCVLTTPLACRLFAVPLP